MCSLSIFSPQKCGLPPSSASSSLMFSLQSRPFSNVISGCSGCNPLRQPTLCPFRKVCLRGPTFGVPPSFCFELARPKSANGLTLFLRPLIRAAAMIRGTGTTLGVAVGMVI